MKINPEKKGQTGKGERVFEAQQFQRQQRSEAFTAIANILYQRKDLRNTQYCIQQALHLNPNNKQAKQYAQQWKQEFASVK